MKKDNMKKLLLFLGLVMLGMNSQAKEYKYETVPGDMMKTRIYTLDNGLKVYLSANPENLADNLENMMRDPQQPSKL